LNACPEATIDSASSNLMNKKIKMSKKIQEAGNKQKFKKLYKNQEMHAKHAILI
jgi:hypothetical protein